MNTENITRVRRLDLNTGLYSGSAYQSQGSSAAGHWINIYIYICEAIRSNPVACLNFLQGVNTPYLVQCSKLVQTRSQYYVCVLFNFKDCNYLKKTKKNITIVSKNNSYEKNVQ